MNWFWLSGVVLILDQGSKWFADALLGPHDVVPLLPFLDLRKAYNPGAAFSFLSDASGWQRWFFSGLAVLIIGVLVVWLRRLPRGQSRVALALALILGGAAGNLVDRVLYGHVIDFIDLYYGDLALAHFQYCRFGHHARRGTVDPGCLAWGAGSGPEKAINSTQRRRAAAWKGNKLTAETQRTQSVFIVFVKEFLCVLCVFAVKSVFIDAHYLSRSQ